MLKNNSFTPLALEFATTNDNPSPLSSAHTMTGKYNNTIMTQEGYTQQPFTSTTNCIGYPAQKNQCTLTMKNPTGTPHTVPTPMTKSGTVLPCGPTSAPDNINKSVTTTHTNTTHAAKNTIMG
eukprot:3410561-Ditylum_brightwellii.AAC.1